MDLLLPFIDQYGYISLFVLLCLGIVGVPVPDEILMTTVGSLTAGNEPILSYGPCLLASFAGTMTGMMTSYMLGLKVGKPFLYRFGRWFKLTPGRLAVAEGWFQRYGLWAVAFGYYIPGIRHFTCYLAGASNVKLWKYVLVAGSGAFVWCLTFLTLGHVIGINAPAILEAIHRYLSICVAAVVIVAAAGGYVYWRFRKRTEPGS